MAALIDLHLHTTASDGCFTPEELVSRAAALGMRAISVTDHDTRAAIPAAAAAASAVGIEFVPGIEITAVQDGRDVHVLAYNLPAEAPAVDALLARQRQARIERAVEIANRLAQLDVPIDVAVLMTTADRMTGKAIARPQIAQLLVTAGHVVSIAEAFERYLGEGCPGYVPHVGATPTEVVTLIRDHGGVSSLAHPGQTGRDDIIPALVEAGLSCLEAYHSAHDVAIEARYIQLARHYGLGVSGGSDYHGPDARRAAFFGVTGLPEADYHVFKRAMEAARDLAARRLRGD